MTKLKSNNHNRPKSNSRRSSNKPRNKGPNVSLDTISTLFVGCPRCGFFLSGYRARIGLPQLEQAVAQLQDVQRDWLQLGWQHAMLDLVERTYGCEIPSDTYHFEYRCGECGRVMVLEESAEQQKSLRIQVMPRIRYLNRD